jgi:hypothetical protein
MFPRLPVPSYPLISSHSDNLRSAAPLLNGHPLNHAIQVSVPYHGSDALAKRIEKAFAGTELFYYVVKCSLGQLLDAEFVKKHVGASADKGWQTCFWKDSFQSQTY